MEEITILDACCRIFWFDKSLSDPNMDIGAKKNLRPWKKINVDPDIRDMPFKNNTVGRFDHLIKMGWANSISCIIT